MSDESDNGSSNSDGSDGSSEEYNSGKSEEEEEEILFVETKEHKRPQENCGTSEDETNKHQTQDDTSIKKPSVQMDIDPTKETIQSELTKEQGRQQEKQETIETNFNEKTNKWNKIPLGAKSYRPPYKCITEKLKEGNLYYDLRFMKRFYYSWYPNKDMMDLKLDQWRDICEIAINSSQQQFNEKGIGVNDINKMKKCIVGLSRSNPNVLFEVREGRTKNTVAARAWKAVSEYVGNDYTPKRISSSGRSNNLEGKDNSDSNRTTNKNKEKRVMLNKVSQRVPNYQLILVTSNTNIGLT